MSIQEVMHIKSGENRLARIIKRTKVPKEKFPNATEELGKYMKLVIIEDDLV